MEPAMREWWHTGLVPANPDALGEVPQLEFLNGLRSWYLTHRNETLSNLVLAEIAMVSQTTVESWRTSVGLKNHRNMEVRDRLFVVLRLQDLLVSKEAVDSVRVPKTRASRGQVTQWSLEELRILETNYPTTTAVDMQKHLPNRSVKAIRHMAHQLGLQRYVIKRWAAWEIELVHREYPLPNGVKRIQEATGRSREHIKSKAQWLGLERNNTAMWTPEEDAILAQFYPISVNECVEKLPHRSRATIIGRAGALKIKSSRGWSEEELETLKAKYPLYGLACRQYLPNRTEDAIKQYARRLKLINPTKK